MSNAEREARRAKSSELAASALLELAKPVPDPSLPLILAREAVNMTRSRDGYVVLNAGHALDEAVRKAPPWLRTLVGHMGQIKSAVFSSDDQWVVTTSWDETARVWDAASGQLHATLTGHSGSILSAAFSPDGQRVVTAGADKTARVWDAASGRLLVTLAACRRACVSGVSLWYTVGIAESLHSA
jgi:WD40 repeat protein